MQLNNIIVRLGGGDPGHYASEDLPSATVRHELRHYALRGWLLIVSCVMAAASAAIASSVVRGGGLAAVDVGAAVIAMVVWGAVERTVAEGGKRRSLAIIRTTMSVLFALVVTHLVLVQVFADDVHRELERQAVARAERAVRAADADVAAAEDRQQRSPERTRLQQAVAEAESRLSAQSVYTPPDCTASPYRGCSTEARETRRLQLQEEEQRQRAVTDARAALESWIARNTVDIDVARTEAMAARDTLERTNADPLAGETIGLRTRLDALIPALGIGQFALWAGLLLSIDLALLTFVAFSAPTSYDVYCEEATERFVVLHRNETKRRAAEIERDTLIATRTASRDIAIHGLQCERWERLEEEIATRKAEREERLLAASKVSHMVGERARANLRLVEGGTGG